MNSRGNRYQRRDRKRHRRRHGMRVVGASVKLLDRLAQERAEKSNTKNSPNSQGD